ncbi:MAG TPA: hypothetical protein PK379_00010 [Candidatus Hydrogenedentes bacterium]|nr:hypothetical protein [Candidatus Hydrogenedentota bacterium]HOK88385.1 hypothetical protein [Candidatus Hydrogenedentota bacterium]
MNIRLYLWAGCALLLALGIAGCGKPATRDIPEVRQASPESSAMPPAPLATPERMGLTAAAGSPSAAPGENLPANPPGPGLVANTPPAEDSPYAWTLPEGWRELPPRPMRLATFAVGEAECYIAVLAGDGGGVAANINRWRRQMGLEPLDDAAIDALPTLAVLGGPAPLVEMEGTYRDMNGNTLEQAGFLGIVRELGDQTLFIRVTGPAEVVRAHKAEFLSFCESLRERSTP